MNSEAPRVLLLTDADVFAGTERHILELARALQGRRCPVAVGGPAQGVLAVRARAVGIQVFPVEKRGSVDFRAVGRLWLALRRGQFDVIHAHNGRTAFLAALATWLSNGGQLVTTQHFITPAHANLRGIKALFSRGLHRWIAARTSTVIAISDAVWQSAVARRTVAADKVRVVLNGIFDPRQSDIVPRSVIRAELGIPADAPLLVTSARLEQEKGIETLIDAMPEVLARLPDARCLVAGEGTGRDRLQARIDEKHLAASTKLLGFRADIFSLIAAADGFVLPSPNEPFGLALVEAMGLGKPVIASRAGGPREIIQEGESGLLFTPGDARQLAATILELLTQPSLADRLAANARRAYLERFTAERMAGEVFSIYQEALRRPGAAAKASRPAST